jgi:hypothetical protein
LQLCVDFCSNIIFLSIEQQNGMARWCIFEKPWWPCWNLTCEMMPVRWLQTCWSPVLCCRGKRPINLAIINW